MTLRPYDHTDLAAPLAEYLHTAGVVQNPHGTQISDTDTPAIFVGQLPDKPTIAVSIITVQEQTPDVHDAQPTMTFMIVGRTPPEQPLALDKLMGRIYQALQHRDTRFQLTADRELAYCHRALTGAAVQDENRRYRRVDTYQARVMVPRHMKTH